MAYSTFPPLKTSFRGKRGIKKKFRIIQSPDNLIIIMTKTGILKIKCAETPLYCRRFFFKLAKTHNFIRVYN